MVQRVFRFFSLPYLTKLHRLHFGFTFGIVSFGRIVHMSSLSFFSICINFGQDLSSFFPHVPISVKSCSLHSTFLLFLFALIFYRLGITSCQLSQQVVVDKRPFEIHYSCIADFIGQHLQSRKLDQLGKTKKFLKCSYKPLNM